MMSANLPDGLYPFIDGQFPLNEMTMVEAPADLEVLFKAQAEENNTQIVRGEPVELNCRSEQYPDAKFLIYWPHGEDRIHMLVPTRYAKGRA